MTPLGVRPKRRLAPSPIDFWSRTLGLVPGNRGPKGSCATEAPKAGANETHEELQHERPEDPPSDPVFLMQTPFRASGPNRKKFGEKKTEVSPPPVVKMPTLW